MFYRILAFVTIVVLSTIMFMIATSATTPLISQSNSMAVLFGFVLLVGEIAGFVALLHYSYHRMFRSLPNPFPTPKE